MRTDAGYAGLERAATIHLLRGRADAARKLYQRSFQQVRNPYAALHMALLADAAGDTAGRNSAFEAAVNQGQHSRTSAGTGATALIRVATLLNSFVAAEQGAAFETEKFESLLGRAPEPAQTYMLYFGGRFLGLHGQAEQATALLRRCAESRYQHEHTCVLAREWLRTQGVTPKDVPPLVTFTDE
jgi:hypothetical protein